MSATAEEIIERRRLRRKLVFWRCAGVLGILVAVGVGVLFAIGPDGLSGRSRPHVARITISGFITENREQLQLINHLATDDAVRAVIVSIDSGGGATVGGEALYAALRALSDRKPTVASIKTVGASAAYMAAIATDHVVAYRSSITGSIGVLFQSPEVSGAMQKLGIALVEVKSSPLKAAPSPFSAPSQDALDVVKGMIDSSYQWFVDIVAERRKLDRATALKLADGRVYSGDQAKAVGLVDAIGGENEAGDWLVKDRHIDAELPILDWRTSDVSGGFSLSKAASALLLRQLGLAPDMMDGSDLPPWMPRLDLDGLLSVWQAPAVLDAKGAAR